MRKILFNKKRRTRHLSISYPPLYKRIQNEKAKLSTSDSKSVKILLELLVMSLVLNSKSLGKIKTKYT